MKTLRDLIEENCTFSLSKEKTTDFFETEIKNHELFSESELKSYFNSDKFLNDLFGCLSDFYVAENEGLFQSFELKRSGDGITIVMNAISIPD